MATNVVLLAKEIATLRNELREYGDFEYDRTKKFVSIDMYEIVTTESEPYPILSKELVDWLSSHVGDGNNRLAIGGSDWYSDYPDDEASFEVYRWEYESNENHLARLINERNRLKELKDKKVDHEYIKYLELKEIYEGVKRSNK